MKLRTMGVRAAAIAIAVAAALGLAPGTAQAQQRDPCVDRINAATAHYNLGIFYLNGGNVFYNGGDYTDATIMYTIADGYFRQSADESAGCV